MIIPIAEAPLLIYCQFATRSSRQWFSYYPCNGFLYITSVVKLVDQPLLSDFLQALEGIQILLSLHYGAMEPHTSCADIHRITKYFVKSVLNV